MAAFNFQKKIDCKIALSSDDSEIIFIAKKYGLISDYVRPKKVSSDKSGKLEAIKHLLIYEERKEKIKYDYILDLDITSPLRKVTDLTESLKMIESDRDMLSLFSVSNSRRNPYFNMVEKTPNSKYFDLVKNFSSPPLSRQSSPLVYDLNASFYWYRRSFFETNYKTAITSRSGIYLMNDICFDLDSTEDFDYLEFLLQNKIVEIN